MEAPTSHDFPTNAFALLPASLQMDGADIRRDAVEGAVEGEVQEVAESVCGGDASVENSMALLKFNLAHTELQDMIESLYRAIDAVERKNSELKSENTRLVGDMERAKGEAGKMEATMRRQLCAREEDIKGMQRRIRELEQCKERQSGELAEVKMKLEEKEGIVTQLEEALKVLQEQLCHESQVGMMKRVGEEIRQLTDVWSTKEKCVSESTEHVRNAAVAVQKLGEQLQFQLQRVRAELMDNEKDYSTVRAFIADHRCEDSLTNTKHPPNEQLLNELNAFRKRLNPLQANSLQTTSQCKALQIRCAEYQRSLSILKQKIEDLRQRETSNKALIAKYEESAADGTQTIAELQEALIKLCDQLAQERNRHHSQLEEQFRRGVERETELQASLEDALQRVRNAEEAQAGIPAPPCDRCKSPERSQVRVDRDGGNDEMPHITPSPGETPTIAESGTDNNSLSEQRREKDTDTVREVKQLVKSRPSKTMAIPTSDITCRMCHEEPFGFMVRCQKCKSPFHAGCVKNSASGTKRRLGHIFKCSDCVPQRPMKVVRQSEAVDVGSLPVTTVPSRTPATKSSIARPSSQPKSS